MRIHLLALGTVVATAAWAHKGPDPVMHWELNSKTLQNGKLKARLGPDALFTGAASFAKDALGESLRMDGKSRFIVAQDFKTLAPMMPKHHITASAWATIEEPQGYGCFIGCAQDNGNYEKGWFLGYNDRGFYFALSTKGADDGDGKMTYLVGKTEYEIGRVYHVAGTYDGQTMKLYVNGKLDGTSTAQSGDILYPPKAPLTIGVYKDDDEDFPHKGRLRDVALYDLAATADGIDHLFAPRKALVLEKPVVQENPNFEWIVQPFLQYATTNEITVVWETTRAGSSTVHFGTNDKELTKVEGAPGKIHTVRLTGLKPNSHYHYRVESKDDQGRVLTSEMSTFRTAPNAGTPIRFTVVGDTQNNPAVNSVIGNLMWAERPDFLVIPGDLVETGGNKSHWVDHFFGSMRPIFSRVCLFPVLGNHENDARHYYDYMSVPAPEYYYSFVYGDAEFFVIDSNRNVDPSSEQYQWLDRALGASKARWKFVTHHHPPYSSDEDDFGNLWKGQSTFGDVRLRQITPLYEKHGVDVVWNGHIHSYERTWPIVGGQITKSGGVTYVVAGGGGGGLETPGPFKPAFSNVVRRGHHFVVVSLTPWELSMRSFDLEGRLFDTMVIKKD